MAKRWIIWALLWLALGAGAVVRAQNNDYGIDDECYRYFYEGESLIGKDEFCRDIASRLGGRVFLDTSYTGGARFVFTIPINRD